MGFKCIAEEETGFFSLSLEGPVKLKWRTKLDFFHPYVLFLNCMDLISPLCLETEGDREE